MTQDKFFRGVDVTFSLQNFGRRLRVTNALL